MRLVSICVFIISMCTGIDQFGTVPSKKNRIYYCDPKIKKEFNDSFLYKTLKDDQILALEWQNFYQKYKNKENNKSAQTGSLTNNNEANNYFDQNNNLVWVEPRKKCGGLCCTDEVNFIVVIKNGERKDPIFDYVRFSIYAYKTYSKENKNSSNFEEFCKGEGEPVFFQTLKKKFIKPFIDAREKGNPNNKENQKLED